MSFSPRPRPHTVGLSFTDHDLTDTYRDDRSSINGTATSSPQRRHPRGDTPLSRRPVNADDFSSPGRWTVSSRRSVSEKEGELDEEEHERSNLDKLLDLLDDEEDGAEHPYRSPGRNETANRTFATSTPPPPPPGSRSPYPPTTAPRTLASQRHSPPHVSPSTNADPTSTYAATESPSLRAHQRSLSSLSAPVARPNSALARFQRSHGRADGAEGGRGAGLPDSPSPRPGSVAALRGKGEASFATAAERSGASAAALPEAHRLREDGQGKTQGHDQGGEDAGGEDRDEEHREETSTEAGSLDSVARVAQAAMDEFDNIISQGVSSSSRSASRLRNIPSPARTPSASSPRPPAQYRRTSPPSAAGGPAHDDLNAHLVQELRDAQDYIAYLQDELRSISDVVVQLRERPEQGSPPTAHENDFATSGTPSPATQRTRAELHSDGGSTGALRAEEEQVVLEEANRAAYEVVSHLTSLLPTLSLGPLNSTTPQQPSLNSLSLALTFTRQMDQLAHNLPHQRRDEDVFTRGNLESVRRRVGGWERVVRGGGETEE
ncbi:hypothetical protein JCM11251_007320 [Rhodosporidiobolus azoricus]